MSAQPATTSGGSDDPFDWNDLPTSPGQGGSPDGFPDPFAASPGGNSAFLPAPAAGGFGSFPQPAVGLAGGGGRTAGGTGWKLKGAPLKILIGLGLLLGAGVGLVTVVLLIGFIATQFPQSKKTMELAGWSAEAPGRTVPDQKRGRTEAKFIINPRTNSEFSLGTVDLPPNAMVVGGDQFLQLLKSQITDIREDRAVERAGLKGLHVKGKASFNPMLATFEMFPLPGNQLLVMAYLNGTDRQKMGIGKTRLDEDRIEAMDDPEAFFASLRRSGE